MIDFQDTHFVKVVVAKKTAFNTLLNELLTEDEKVIEIYTSMRNEIIFTSKRVFIIDIQFFSRKTPDITSLSLKALKTFSIECFSTIKETSEIELSFADLGSICLSFLDKKTDTSAICRLLNQYIV